MTSEPQAAKASGIMQQILELESAAEVLGKAIESLEEKLNPILSETMCMPAKRDNDVSPNKSPAGLKLDAVIGSLRNAVESISDLEHQAEL